jgi:hypothetical protein
MLAGANIRGDSGNAVWLPMEGIADVGDKRKKNRFNVVKRAQEKERRNRIGSSTMQQTSK